MDAEWLTQREAWDLKWVCLSAAARLAERTWGSWRAQRCLRPLILAAPYKKGELPEVVDCPILWGKEGRCSGEEASQQVLRWLADASEHAFCARQRGNCFPSHASKAPLPPHEVILLRREFKRAKLPDREAYFEEVKRDEVRTSPAVMNALAAVARCAGCYVADLGSYRRVAPALASLERAWASCSGPSTQEPWRGANLGGWFLLEPGPASPFFDEAGVPNRGDEWSLCEALGDRKGEVVRGHRRQHFGRQTFADLRSHGLNAARLPFGYWVLTEVPASEPYVGPDLDALDLAVQWAGEEGIMLLLDLHGNPGGENADRPCGHEWPEWTPDKWRQKEALDCLAIVVSRYCNETSSEYNHVAGIQVCNEVSESISIDNLLDFYEEAIKTIRDINTRIAVVLPIFSHFRVCSVVEAWAARGNFLRYYNIVFDLHYYHTFSPMWEWLSHAAHLDVAAAHGRELYDIPNAVVGEWSCARSKPFKEDEIKEFASIQVSAYGLASHGWFFWTWHDHADLPEWDMERGIFGRARLPLPLPLPLASPKGAASCGDARPDFEDALAAQDRRSLWPAVLECFAWAYPCIGPLFGPDGLLGGAGLRAGARRHWVGSRPRPGSCYTNAAPSEPTSLFRTRSASRNG